MYPMYAVDVHQQGRYLLHVLGVIEGAGIHGTQVRNLPRQVNNHLLGLGVVGADDHVLVQGDAGLEQFLGGHVLEGRDHSRLGRCGLGFLRRRAGLDFLGDGPDAALEAHWRDHRHHRLAVQRVAHAGDGGRHPVVWHG